MILCWKLVQLVAPNLFHADAAVWQLAFHMKTDSETTPTDSFVHNTDISQPLS